MGRINQSQGCAPLLYPTKAEDTKLGRPVALKFLAPHLLRDEEGLKRFHREAKAAAKLDHPNICTVYEIDEVDGKTFIVMAFLEGLPLSKKIADGPLKLHEALSVAGQIAEGLEAAHENGVVHRDIKPDNIMLLKGSRGLVKIMDFGLVQLAGGSKFTREGTTLGTMAYMSPEQAQGAEVDRRSDIWSFGVVLYEMVSGQPPFRGDFDQAVVYSIVNEAPEPLTAVRTGVPKELESIVNKALSKKPDDRYQHADELLVDLRRLQKERESGQTRAGVPVPKRSRTGFYAAVTAVIAVALGLAAWLGVWSPTGREPPAPLRAVPLTSDPGRELHPTFSPDGNQVAFDWDGENRDNTDIYVKLVAGGRPLRLTTNPAVDSRPAWSPDGSQIAFLRRSKGSVGIFLVPPIGGSERKLAESPHFGVGFWSGLSWSPDGKFLAVPDRTSPEEPFAIFLVSVESGEKRRLTSPPAQSLADHSPAFSPDGRTLAFVRQSAVVIANVYLVQVAGGEPRRLTFKDQQMLGLAWTPDGREIVFSAVPAASSSNNSLWRISSLGGMPELLSGTGGGAIYPAISRQGSRLIYSRQTSDRNIWRLELSGLTSTRNRPTKLIASTRTDFFPQISPEGDRIAFESDRSGSPEVWVCDLDGRRPGQLTSFVDVNAGAPCWSPDGRWIAFDAAPDGNGDIYVISADGGSPRRLTTEGSGESVPSWSRDGKWIYFSSNRTGIFQVWKAPAAGGEAVQVTKQGGHYGFESPDGKFVFYTKPEGSLWEQPAVWRVPAEGGEEVAVLDSPRPVSFRAWAVVEQGIYFIDVERSEALVAESFLKFFRFDTGRVTRIASLGEQPGTGGVHVAVSPDGGWILYTQDDQTGADLMLLENFR